MKIIELVLEITYIPFFSVLEIRKTSFAFIVGLIPVLVFKTLHHERLDYDYSHPLKHQILNLIKL